MTGTRRITNRTIKLRSGLVSIREKLAFLLDESATVMTPRQREAQLRRLGGTASQLLRDAITAVEGAADFEADDNLAADRLREVAGIVIADIDKMTSECPAIELWDTEAAAMRRHLEMVK